jgi:uncharacterized membrane protein HdeD (DUF308 family)
VTSTPAPRVTQITVEPGRAWGWVLASGILSTLLGITVLATSAANRTWLLAIWVGVSFLLIGIQRLALAAVDAENRGIAVVSGALSVITAFVIFFWPDETLLVLAIFAGVSALVGGLLDLVAGLRGRTRDKTSAVVRGVIGIAIGVAILVWPEATIGVIAILLGAFLLLQGLFMIISAFALRSVSTALKEEYGATGAVVTVTDSGTGEPDVRVDPIPLDLGRPGSPTPPLP